MKIHFLDLTLTLGLLPPLNLLHAADPVVTNVTAAQQAGTKKVEITFDVSDDDSDTLAISVNVSDDAGATFDVPGTALSGDLSIDATPIATSHAVVWDAGIDFNQQFNSDMVVRVIADDGSAPGPAPPGMVLIPAGVFTMGDQQVPPILGRAFPEGENLPDADNYELPVHEVYISAFYMDKHEVSWEMWNEVRNWALQNGYEIGAGDGQGAQHPVHSVNWYDAVKWCNARSEKEGLTPVYRTFQQSVYRQFEVAPPPSIQNWTANGYRLPTEAEWEKTARGGLVSNQYPLGTAITGADGNYLGSGDPFEPYEPSTTPVDFYDGKQWKPYPADRANGYEVYGVVGNVREWCWDVYKSDWYGDPGAIVADTRGPNTSSGDRVNRGGSWFNTLDELHNRCARRNSGSPGSSNWTYGFRCARGL